MKRTARVGLVAAAVASVALAAAPASSAYGSYAPGDRLHSTLTWWTAPGGNDCIEVEWTRPDWSVAVEWRCGGRLAIDQSAALGKWVGLEPHRRGGVSFACSTWDFSNGQMLRQGSGSWPTDDIFTLATDAASSGGPQAPACLVELR